MSQCDGLAGRRGSGASTDGRGRRHAAIASLPVGLVIGQLSAGGAERQLWHLCREVLHHGVAPVVYCLSDHTQPYGPLIEAAGVPVHVIDGGRLHRVRELRRRLDADRIAVVHAWLFVANAYAWTANRGRRRPLVTSARNCKRQGRVLDALNRRAFAGSDVIVANSNAVKQYIEHEYGAPAERVAVVYNAIDTECFRPEGAPDGTVLGPIVTVGRLVPQKNHELFLRGAARLVASITSARFVIVGDGPLRARLQEQARRLGIVHHVSFVGARLDVEDILRTASLLWLTSHWEGMPNVVLEAMASGVPAIATDVGGTRELIRSGIDGFIVPPGDVEAFVHHSQDLLRNETRRRRFGAAARARAQEFSPARMVDAMSRLYAEVARVR